MLASTSAEGDVAIFRVTEPEAPAPGSSPAYAPAVNLKGGHKDVSRHVYPRYLPLLKLAKQPARLTQHFAISETSFASVPERSFCNHLASCFNLDPL